MTTPDFKFYVPIDFQKGGEGEKEMIFEGLASDTTEDSDEEILEPEGFDLSDFNWINWDHNRGPDAIVGEPIDYWIKDKKFFVKGFLYPDLQKAKDIWKLGQALSKSKKGNRLKLSVEGKALERDFVNPKRITKAKITAVAICTTPKNGSTWIDFLKKGFTNEVEEDANGGQEFILDLTLEGNRVVITKEKKILFFPIQKMDTASVAPLTKESLMGANNKKEKKLPENFFLMQKSFIFEPEFYETLSSSLEGDESLKIKLYKSIVERNLHKKMQVDKILKGLQYLDKMGSDIEKAMNGEEQNGGEESDAMKGITSMCKAGASKEDIYKKYGSKMSKEEFDKAYKSAMGKGEDEEEDGEDIEKVKKSVSMLLDAQVDEDIISKSLGVSKDFISSLKTPESDVDRLLKSFNSKFEEFSQKVESLIEQNEELKEALNQPIRKGITATGWVQRGNEKQKDSNSKQISKSDRASILKIADSLIDYNDLRKSENASLAEAVSAFEISGHISPALVSAFQNAGYSLV